MKTKQKLGILLLLLCLSVIALTLCASAATYSGKCGDNLTYTLNINTNTGVLTISGTGAMADWSDSNGNVAPWHSYRSSIRSVQISKVVTSIGAYAFSGCSSLTSITIPNRVTSIGEGAFKGCSSLTSISIPSGVTSIGAYAFTNCSGFTSITIPDSVTSIGTSAFEGCSSLTSISIPFVGASRDAKNGYDQVLGYIFGYISSAGGDNTTKQYDGYYYFIPSTLRNVTVTNAAAIPKNAFYNCSNLTSISIPDSVTSIGEGAFKGCSSLTSITIPSRVTSIGNRAFYNCSSLNAVYITDIAAWCGIAFGRVYANPLYYAHNLYLSGELATDLVIPDSVTSIGRYAFQDCSSLASISIPDSVTSIGEEAFSGSSLNAVYITDIAAWCRIAFGTYDCNPLYYAHNLYLSGELATDLVIPDSVTSIGNYAFYGCSSLTSISIPDSVTSIGRYAFQGCSSLASISIPDSVTSIGASAFSGTAWFLNKPEGVVYAGRIAYACKGNVFSVSLEEGTTCIGYYAFSGCSNLTSISIPDSVTSIEARAFYNCSSLNAVYITDIAAWCRIAFSYFDANPLYYAHNLYLNGELVTDLVIPSSVTSIGRYAFQGCSSLASVSIPSSVTSIGNHAFRYCSNLKRITIPDSVTSIGAATFSGCSSITSITIPDSVTSIDMEAFRNCSSLTSITILNPNCWIFDSQDAMPSAAAIYGYTDSTAAAYAVKYGRSFVPIGGSCGDKLAFRMNLDTGVLSITGTGGMDSWYLDDSPWYVYRASIRSIRIASGATSIGDFAFDGCSNLVDVVIAETVESIGDGAFDNCTSLAEVTIFNGTCKIPDRSDAFPASVTIHGHAGSTAEAYAKQYNRTFKQIGHTHVYAEDYTVDVPASCTTAGTKSRHCTVEGCTETIDSTVIPAAGHKFGAWNVRTPAKCEEIGVDYRVCAVCQQEETRTTAKLGHDYADAWTVDKVETCTTPGSKSHHCTRCNAVADVTEIPAAGHRFGAWNVRTPAKCEETGVDYRVCAVCQQEETRTTAKLGHDYADAWTVDKAETCTTPGSKSHHCTRCDAVADVTEIPAAGHKFGAWTIIREATLDDTGERTHTCEVCGTTETETTPRRVRGDADGDGAVTIRDALLVLRAVLDGAAVNPYMDANGDGKLMLADVLLILRLAA